MKKVNIKDTDLLTAIGDTNKNNIIGLTKKFLPTKINIDQYILLTKRGSNDWGVNSGIISFGQHATDQMYIGLFTITNPFRDGLTSATSTDTNMKFYRVKKEGTDYVAIRKVAPRMDRGVWLLSMHSDNTSVFEVVDVDQLTDIVAI